MSEVRIPAATLRQRGFVLKVLITAASSRAASLNCCGLTASTTTSDDSMCADNFLIFSAVMMDSSDSSRWRVWS